VNCGTDGSRGIVFGPDRNDPLDPKPDAPRPQRLDDDDGETIPARSAGRREMDQALRRREPVLPSDFCDTRSCPI
jgi:hypothetical protein